MLGFGLRFGWPRELYVSICFRCNNIYVDREMMTFDAGSPQARKLLAFYNPARRLTGRAGSERP